MKNHNPESLSIQSEPDGLQKNRHKSRRRITAALALLLAVSLALLTGVTAAWYNLNRKVSAAESILVAEAGSNLVISGTEAGLNDRLPHVEFTDSLKLIPSRHVSSSEPITSSDTGLYYHASPLKIDTENGLIKSDATSATSDYAAVPTDGDGEYYKDYLVYLATTGQEIVTDSLTVTLSLENDSAGSTLPDYMYAASIDFYTVSGTSSSYTYSYVDTLNCKGQDWTNATTTADDGTVTYNSKSSITIGISNTLTSETNKGKKGIPMIDDGHIVILLRCYYDGGLLKSDGQTYVYSAGLTGDAAKMRAYFTAGHSSTT